MSMPWKVVCTPNCSPSRAWSASSPACSSALVGMQPRCRQVPPTLSFSTMTTVRPSSAARNAHAYPPLPAPRMTRSAVWVSGTARLEGGRVGGVKLRDGSEIAARAVVAAVPHHVLPRILPEEIGRLTGVLNRGALEGRLASELARARRYGRPLGLLTFDVAGLKAINDAHGHSAGDEVLRGVAGILTASVRDHDLVGRMGGDEYAVVVTEQSRAGTEKVLDRIRSQIPQRRTALGLSTHWGLSAGVAEFPNDGETAEELLEAADRRLYLSRGIHIQPVS